MGTKYECDVEGCTETTSKPGVTRSMISRLPEGWCRVMIAPPPDELTNRRPKPGPVQGLSPNARVAAVSEGYAEGRRMMENLMLVCPKHPMPKFKPVEPDPDDDGFFMGPD